MSFNPSDRAVQNPLTEAAYEGSIDLVHSILNNFTHPDTPNSDYITPLSCAAAGGCLEVVKILHGAGADINGELTTAGIMAANRLFSDAGGQVENYSKMRVARVSTPLMCASSWAGGAGRRRRHAARAEALLRYLIEHGANVNATDGSGRTALHYAVSEDSELAVRVLLEAGIDTSIPDDYGDTASDVALKPGYNSELETLISSYVAPETTI
ncbi:MAG: ankyrin repeat domain-containing protein [Capsulimonadaceae bacterium]